MARNAICAAKGFSAGAVSAGIKKGGKPDLALIFSEVPALACGLFTSNKVKAAPVILSQQRSKKGKAQAILINSGNANCATGANGLNDAKKICQEAAKTLGIKQNLVLNASTGIIGKRLPVKKILNKIPCLVEKISHQHGHLAAKAMMTTDTIPKEAQAKLKIRDKLVTIGALAKGAGMISPHLATMLCFITTDAKIEKKALLLALKNAVAGSFNRITVDGQMSTNDTVLILANGLAKNLTLKQGTKDYQRFSQCLSDVCLKLAKMIVSDGEGATKFVAIKVDGAKTKMQAEKIARNIADSTLVKTAFFGADPNWGRILSAIGASGEEINPHKIMLSLGNIIVFKNGTAVKVDAEQLRKKFLCREIGINVVLNLGKAQTKIYTCDLSKKYVRINAAYST
jgi:glutamate N-acetyltransferase/amino-acid N-acetyltransferase